MSRSYNDKEKPSLEELLRYSLKGIDMTEIEHRDGWWETSVGADFGAYKLQEVLDIVEKYNGR